MTFDPDIWSNLVLARSRLKVKVIVKVHGHEMFVGILVLKWARSRVNDLIIAFSALNCCLSV